MTNPVISVRGLGKKYRIGIKRHDTLRDQIASTFRSLFRRNDNGLRTKDKGHSEEFWALRDVSFDVQQGEAVGIVGRNGAGKSTLFKILNGIISPDKGRVEIRGRVGALIEVGSIVPGLIMSEEKTSLMH